MSIKPALSRSAGWTLAEFVVAMAIAVVLAVMLVSFMLYTGFSLAGLANYVDLESQSQRTLDRLVQDVRVGSKLTDFATNKVVFRDHGSNVFSYVYDPSRRTLTRTVNGTDATEMLQECDGLSFSIFQRSPYLTNMYELYPTTLAATNCKAIAVRWTCSRTILGTRLNTETVQSTKIILRN
jgi:hypothetical protein